MAQPVERLRLLLLQVRDRSAAEHHERECFLAGGGLATDQVRTHNLVRDPQVPWPEVEKADAVVIGGAGAHSVTREYSFSAPLRAAVHRMVEAGKPLFGSCWGHQFIAWALGGEVVTDLERKELGTFEIELTSAGERDPLFDGLPSRFPVQLGHHDRVTRLPPDAVELAFSRRCPNQAFRLRDAPVYGAQFHVELDRDRMLERAAMYREGYLPADDALSELSRQLRPSPEASRLWRRFLELAAAGTDRQ